MSDALRITDTFPDHSRQDWIAMAEKALKGRPLDRLSSKTVDGIEIEPIYERATGKHPLAMRSASMPWAIAQKVDHPEPQKANEQVLLDLDNGVNMLAISFAGAAAAHRFGIAPEKDALAKVLDEVFLDYISVRLEAGAKGCEAAKAFADVVADKGMSPAKLAVSFGMDPIGDFASHGVVAKGWAKRMVETIRDLKAKDFKGPFITVDGRPYHDAGASDAEELGFVLASILAYLRTLEKGGFEVDEAISMIDVTLSVEADQFGSMAKLRAMRQLWARLLEVVGVPFTKLSIHAETSWAMMTRLDPWVNVLRVTVATFAAGVGGADSVCVLPHTAVLGLPEGLSRRVSRNLQTMLIEESNLYRVTDPAAGSGFVEELTEEYAEKAWALFQTIEAQGCIGSALISGLVHDTIAKSVEVRNKLIATRKAALTGASAFPNIAEVPVEIENVAPLAPATGQVEGETCTPLKVVRYSEPYEALRDAAKASIAEPTIFFANMGRIADFTARSTWAKNFFEAGGVRTLSGDDGFNEPEEAVKAFKESGAPILCLVGPDALYEEKGEAFAKALKAAGPKLVYLAGRPKALMEALSAAGVDAYCFESCDVLAELTKIHDVLGIAPVANA